MIEIGGRTRLDPLRALVGVTKACRPPVGLLAIPSTHLLTPRPPWPLSPLDPLSLAINPLNISHLTPHGHYTPSAIVLSCASEAPFLKVVPVSGQ